MVSQAENCFEVCEPIPAVSADNPPKTIRHSRIQPLQPMSATRSKLIIAMADGHIDRTQIVDHRHERASTAVMAAYEVEDEIPVMRAPQRFVVCGDERKRLALVPPAVGVARARAREPERSAGARIHAGFGKWLVGYRRCHFVPTVEHDLKARVG